MNGAPGTQRPNVLLITADQWRGDCLSLAGHPVVRTPNLDALAREGVAFLRHYSCAAPCSPARASLYTGLYQMNHRVCTNGTPLDRRHDTLALAFRRLGYEPVLFGYTDQGTDPRDAHANDPALRTFERVLPGFDVRVLVPEHQRPWLSWLASLGYADALGEGNLHVPASGPDDPPAGAPPRYRAEHTDTAFLVDELLRWTDEQNHARLADPEHAWFAHLSLLRPHPPFTVPPPFDRRYDPADVPAFGGPRDRAAAAALHPLMAWFQSRVGKEHFIAGATGLVRDWDDTALRQIAATYYGMIAEVDEQLGRLFAALKRSGTWDDTLVVFTSDHGEMLGDHGLLGKGGFLDSSYHVPLIVVDPSAAATAGTAVARFTESVDVMPTLLERAGGAAPARLDGVSLSPFLDGGPGGSGAGGTARPARRDAACWEYDFRDVELRHAERHFGLPSERCNLAVYRTDALKYVHFAGLAPLLFDLVADPGESVNVADDPRYAGRRLECAEAMLAWRAAHLDRTLASTKLTARGAVRGPPPVAP